MRLPVVALLKSGHPGPALAVTALTAALSVEVGLAPLRIVLLALAMAADQWSVGLSNDWLDADRDAAVGRRDKPIVLGQVHVRTVRAAAFCCAAASLLLTAPLGVPALLVHAISLASAWGYNLWLKNSALSVVPYILSFGLLPLIVTLSLPSPAVPAPWVFATGASLGIAAHFANALPDFDDDARTGVRGLPHRLGPRLSILVTFFALAAAACLVVFGGAITSPLGWAGLAVSLGIALLGVTIGLRTRPGRLLFRLVILAAIVDIALLLFSGTSLLG